MATIVIQVVARENSGGNFLVLFTWLQQMGLGFGHPANNAVVSLSDDGLPVATTADDVLNRIRASQAGNVQMWHITGYDLVVSWTPTELTIFLDGKTVDQKREITRSIFDNYFKVPDGYISEWKICMGIEDVVLGEG